MAWERSFEKKILKIRDKELKYQKLNYLIEVCHLNFFYPRLSDEVLGDRLSGIVFGWCYRSD